MAKLDNYIERKAKALADRQQDWTANPDSAVATIKASSKVAGITGARPTRMGETVLISDSAPGLAGHALGPTAPEMLLGALASCLVHTYLIQATLMNIPLDHVEVEVSCKLDYKGVIGMVSDAPPALTNMTYRPHVESPSSAEAINQLHANVAETCPVLNTLRWPLQVERATS
jgi:uncharacterized OsmC-like protein